MLTKNLFEASQIRSFDPDTKTIVFISYRRTICDRHMARQCATIFERITGLSYWLDEDDECMQQAQSNISDVQTALCIEQGLDIASALLGIIGPGTFTSPWIPYEIGGARGRQRFSKPFNIPPSVPHPLIAHLIHDIEIDEAPAFIALGTPLTSLDEVYRWGMSVAEILARDFQGRRIIKSINETRQVQDRYGVKDIYERNTRHLRYR